MGELAQAHRTRHARTALERVQRTPQRVGGFLLARIAAPRAKLLAGLWKQLGSLL